MQHNAGLFSRVVTETVTGVVNNKATGGGTGVVSAVVTGAFTGVDTEDDVSGMSQRAKCGCWMCLQPEYLSAKQGDSQPCLPCYGRNNSQRLVAGLKNRPLLQVKLHISSHLHTCTHTPSDSATQLYCRQHCMMVVTCSLHC